MLSDFPMRGDCIHGRHRPQPKTSRITLGRYLLKLPNPGQGHEQSRFDEALFHVHEQVGPSCKNRRVRTVLIQD